MIYKVIKTGETTIVLSRTTTRVAAEMWFNRFIAWNASSPFTLELRKGAVTIKECTVLNNAYAAGERPNHE